MVHAPNMVGKLGGLGRFSGERLEKLNDEVKGKKTMDWQFFVLLRESSYFRHFMNKITTRLF